MNLVTVAFRPLLAALCAAFLVGSALAQHAGHSHAGSSAATPGASAGATSNGVVEMSDGEVRRVDKEAGKLTLRHGEIKNLDMPPMTMVFQVKEPALLEKVKAGDKVKFRAEKVGSGYVVTALEVSAAR